jgi:TetR/AcrR family transcriptional regulator, cholesterol catabolism regulator
MSSRPRRSREDQTKVILDTVIGLLESDGYDSVKVREVAKRARISLVTLYSLYPSRDELIVSAVESWLRDEVFHEVVTVSPDATLSEALIQLLGIVMKPWESNPRMLEALFRARESPGSQRLEVLGFAFSGEVLDPVLKKENSDHVGDVFMILRYVSSDVMAKCARGEMAVTEMLPILERTIYLLTSDEEGKGRRAGSWESREGRRQRSSERWPTT